jgi:hypothetical protein
MSVSVVGLYRNLTAAFERFMAGSAGAGTRLCPMAELALTSVDEHHLAGRERLAGRRAAPPASPARRPSQASQTTFAPPRTGPPPSGMFLRSSRSATVRRRRSSSRPSSAFR